MSAVQSTHERLVARGNAAVKGDPDVRQFAALASSWPPLDQLPEPETPAPPAFPFDGLGPILGAAARSIAEGVQAPDALAGGSVLASAALACQPHADILMPHGVRAPPSLFIVTGALSGDRKTATDNIANLPAEECRREQVKASAQVHGCVRG